MLSKLLKFSKRIRNKIVYGGHTCIFSLSVTKFISLCIFLTLEIPRNLPIFWEVSLKENFPHCKKKIVPDLQHHIYDAVMHHKVLLCGHINSRVQ